MGNLFIKRTESVNIDLLHEQLSEITGYEAVSVSPSGIRAYFSGDVDTASVQAIISVHDGEALSTKEEAVITLEGDINALKGEVGNIDNLTATEATSAIKLLYKVLRVNELI